MQFLHRLCTVLKYMQPTNVAASFTSMWSEKRSGYVDKGILLQVSDYPLIANVTPVRQLWVNSSRATRNFIDGETQGLTVTPTGYKTAAKLDWMSGAVEAQTELRWPRQLRNWIEPRCVIVAANDTDITIDPLCWSNLKVRNNNALPPVPKYIENVQGPPGPGEFMATSQYIFYRPASPFPYSDPYCQDKLLIASNHSSGHSQRTASSFLRVTIE
eukprot:m.196337 g.196337  ORF g.196337 m.196337 type:complete len:215 (-) comp18690_c0_seq6:2243-2887(-)